MRHLRRDPPRRDVPGRFAPRMHRRAILQQETRRHGLLKARGIARSFAAMQDSILTGCAPTRRQIACDSSYPCRTRLFRMFAREGSCARSDQRSIASPVEQARFEGMQASDSRAGFVVGPVDLRRRTGVMAAFAMHSAANGTIPEYLFKTKACSDVLRRSACYLCNTHRKTGCAGPFEAVPLLRVQNASVIVTVRRRGASRGRPVLGGSLKSTHATRSR